MSWRYASTPILTNGAAKMPPSAPARIAPPVVANSTTSPLSLSDAPSANCETTVCSGPLAMSTKISIQTASLSPPVPSAMSTANAPPMNAPNIGM